jgi:hypothetical protein
MPRRYKISASWTTKAGGRMFLGQSEMGEGMKLLPTLRLWIWFLVKHRTFARITRKRPQRIFFSSNRSILDELAEKHDA